MLHALAKNWWALALRGVVAILFGILAFLMPGATVLSLVLLFGVYALADGVFDIIASFRASSHHWALLLQGIVSILAGVITFASPGLTAIALLYLIGFWAIITGVLEVATGIRLRKVITNEWIFVLMGIASFLFGMLILLAPAAGAIGVVAWIATYALIFGFMMLAFAFRLRWFSHHFPGTAEPLPS